MHNEARSWALARAAVVNLSISDPTYREKLNALSEAEDMLSRSALVDVPAVESIGCTCSGCGLKYRGDLLVPVDVWERISPVSDGGDKWAGLLCASCIMERIVVAGIWTVGRACDGDLYASPVRVPAVESEPVAIPEGWRLVPEAADARMVYAINEWTDENPREPGYGYSDAESAKLYDFVVNLCDPPGSPVRSALAPAPALKSEVAE